MNSRILVVGGGIGGLTAAIALREAGATVSLVERAPKFGAVGAGITIQANAHAVLGALEVALPPEDVTVLGEVQVTSGDRIVLKSDGRALCDLPPSITVHRADLHAALLRAAASVPHRLGVAVKAVREAVSGVDVELDDGSVERWDLVVGADGVHSAVRACLHPDEPPPRYAGQTCWRFALSAPDLVPDVTVERWAPGHRIGVVPLSRGRVYVFLVASAPAGTSASGSASPEALRRFAGLDERVDAMLERLDGVPIHHGDLVDRPDVSFGRGRVVLLGDAAHAMTPNLGQGAGMAIEDAVALALAVRDGAPDLPAALRAARLARVRSVARTSWRIGQVAHAKSPLVRWLRDRAMALVPASQAERQARAMFSPGIALAARWSREMSPRAPAPVRALAA